MILNINILQFYPISDCRYHLPIFRHSPWVIEYRYRPFGQLVSANQGVPSKLYPHLLWHISLRYPIPMLFLIVYISISLKITLSFPFSFSHLCFLPQRNFGSEMDQNIVKNKLNSGCGRYEVSWENIGNAQQVKQHQWRVLKIKLAFNYNYLLSPTSHMNIDHGWCVTQCHYWPCLSLIDFNYILIEQVTQHHLPRLK